MQQSSVVQSANPTINSLDPKSQLSTIVQNLTISHKKDHSDFPYQLFLNIKSLATEPNFLNIDGYTPAPVGYRKEILYSSCEGMQPFCLTLIVLAPGQKTPIHSHRVDCGPICLRGELEEERFEEIGPEAKEPKLKLFAKNSYCKGEGGYLYKDKPNIHRISNQSQGIAMSLHLYLFNPNDSEQQECTSILKCYSDDSYTDPC